MRVIKSFLLKLKGKLPVIAFDTLTIPVSWYGAYSLYYNMQAIPLEFITKYSGFALLVLFFIQTACYYYFKLYRGLWRFSSVNDLGKILKSVISAVIITVPILYFTSTLAPLPRSIIPLYIIIQTMFLSGGRLFFRYRADKLNSLKSDNGRQKVLIVGAGQAAEGIIRDLKRTKSYYPLGIVDDNQSKKRLEIHGVGVLGAIDKLPIFCENLAVDLVFIAIPSATSAQMRRIVSICESAKISFRTLPGLQDLISGKVQVNALRPVNIDDLLGRDQVKLEWSKIKDSVAGKKVLVTGGGGSIGSELCRQILNLNPESLLIIDNCEYNLYKIEQELQNKTSIKINAILANVTDNVAVADIFEKFRPNLVFHAAAFKHVPLLESQIRAAVLNNVIGTKIVTKASIDNDVEKFVLISTDKAVNPTNIMGATKRVAEIYCQNLNGRVACQFLTVRFGNVLGSVGSVVPLFQNQLNKGGPLTVTHPDIKRYFMTIPEACQLILQAMTNGRGGEIFVLDMGEPIKINYLAEQMIRLSGKEPHRDIKIEYTGLRPGEKLFEELFLDTESMQKTDHQKLFMAQFQKLNWDDLLSSIRLIEIAVKENNVEELIIIIKNLVPTSNAEQTIPTC